MSHELTQRRDGFVEMAYVGEMPWHGLGQELTAGASIEDWIVAAGMDWQIKRSRVRFGEGANQRIVDSQHVLFRSDTKDYLGIVSDKYEIVQPREHLEAFQDLLPHGFTLETAGTMFGGKRFWALASIGETAVIMGDDQVKGYLLFAGSADGTMPTIGKKVATRVVCNNTMRVAMSEKTDSIVKVSHRTAADFGRIKDRLGIARGEFAQYIGAARKLALTTVNKDEARQMTASLLVDSKTVTKEDVSQSSGFRQILSLFQHGKGNHGETAWDWLNGVTEWVDHVQRAKSDSHRMANTMFGKGDALKTMAFERALAMAD